MANTAKPIEKGSAGEGPRGRWVPAASPPPLSPSAYNGGWEGVWGRAEDWPAPGPHPELPLLLVGTVHGDPQGYARAWQLLKHFRPQAVGVEISPFSVRYREHHGPRWQRLMEEALAALPGEAASHLAVRRLLAQAAMPFEWQVAADYGRAFGAKVQAVDLSAPARRHLPAYAREVLVPENVQALLASPDGELGEFVIREFRRARFAALRPLALPAGGCFPETARREAHMARRLRRWAAAGFRVVHLGGWEHLAPRLNGESLFDRLADLKPVRMLLDEADRLPGGLVPELPAAPRQERSPWKSVR